MIVPVGHHISTKAKDKQGSYCIYAVYIVMCMHVMYIAIIPYTATYHFRLKWHRNRGAPEPPWVWSTYH